MSTLIDHQGIVFEVVIDASDVGRNKMAEGKRRRAQGINIHIHFIGFPLALRQFENSDNPVNWKIDVKAFGL